MCRFLYLNVNSGVIRGKSQNTIYKWTGMLNLHVPKKCFFGDKFISESIRPLKLFVIWHTQKSEKAKLMQRK